MIAWLRRLIRRDTPQVARELAKTITAAERVRQGAEEAMRQRSRPTGNLWSEAINPRRHGDEAPRHD